MKTLKLKLNPLFKDIHKATQKASNLHPLFLKASQHFSVRNITLSHDMLFDNSSNIIRKLIDAQILIVDDHLSHACDLLYNIVPSHRNHKIYFSELLTTEQKNIILGMPFSVPGSTNLSSCLGPAEFFNYFNQLHWMKTGILGNMNYDIYNDTSDHLEQRITYLTNIATQNDHRLIFVGGEHTLTFYILRSIKSLFPTRPLNIIHIDAHHDQYVTSSGLNRLNHANFMKYTIDQLQPNIVLQYGQRDKSIAAPIENSPTKQYRARNSDELVQFIQSFQSTNALWYLTIDIDVLDPGIASSVIAPIPNGETISHLTELIKNILQNCKPFSIDFMEICNDSTEYNGSAESAAKILNAIEADL